MEFYFSNTYAIPVLLASILLAFLLVFFQYRTEKDDILSRNQKLILASIRFVAFFLIAFLLTDAAVKRMKHKKPKPIMIVAVDNSKSMQPFKEESQAVISQLNKNFKKVDIHFWQFGDETTKNDQFDFDANNSDYSNLLDEITKTYLNLNIGATLLLGDGIFNKGNDPVFQSRTFPFPVYTIGIGDTTQQVDAAIKHVSHNQTAYLNNHFPIEIGVNFSLASGKQVVLEILKDDATIYTENISIHSNHFFYSNLIHIKADKAGINNYSLRISGLEKESNLLNNNFDFSIFVISKKQKILVMGSAPHPDLSAIYNALKINLNYSVEVQTGLNPNISFDDYGLVIAHQLPNQTREFIPVLNKLMESRKPVLFVLGEKTSLPLFNNIQKNAAIPHTELFEDMSASMNEQFSLFNQESGLDEILINFPPLYTPFTNITLASGFETLLYQRVRNIDTNNPLIALGSKNNARMGFIFGEGIWQWRISDYLQNRNHKQFDNLIQKITNYLVVKPNEDSFNIYHPQIFNESETVTMQAELFNASNEMINEPEVEILILADDSTSYSYIFDKYNLKYQLDAGKLPVGNYSYLAETTIATQKLKKEGAFRISPSQNEILETRANFQVLNQISNNTGGYFFQSNEMDQLFIEIERLKILKSKKIGQSVFQKILDLKWLFILVVFLLTMEWFLRKYWGTY